MRRDFDRQNHDRTVVLAYRNFNPKISYLKKNCKNLDKMAKQDENSAYKSQSAWLGFAEKRRTERGTIRLRLRWSRLAVAFLVLATTGWLAKSAAFYYFFKEYRNFDQVSFVDMLAFPFNRGAVRVAQGNYQIEQAMEAIDRQEVRRAMSLLQNGVLRAPANLEGRKLLIMLYSNWRPELALQLLENGLQYGRNDPDYIRSYTSVLLRNKEDQALMALSDDLLGDDSLDSSIHHIAAVTRMQSAIFRGDFNEVERIYRDRELYRTMDGILLATDVMTRLDHKERSIQLLEAIIRQFPDENLDSVFRRLIIAYREADLPRQAREKAIEYVIRNPLRWEPRVLLIETLDEGGFEERFTREVDSIMREYRNEEAAMAALGQFAAIKGKVRVANRLYELALENNFNLGIFSLLLIESHVKAGRYDEAIGFCNELIRENPAWMSQLESVFNGIRALAYYGSGNSELGNLYLRDFRSSRRASSAQFVQAADAFEKIDLPQPALTLLEEAARRDPDSEQTLSRYIALKMSLGDSYQLTQMLDNLIDMRRPSYKMIQSIYDNLNSDRFIFTTDRPRLISELDKILEEAVLGGINLMPPTRETAETSGS